MIAHADESVHSFGGHRYWNESWYFNFLSEKHDWAGATRIGFSPHPGMRDGFIILYLPDGRCGFIRTCAALGDDLGPHCERLQFECVTPFQQWRIRYDGPLFVFDDPDDACHFHKITLNALPTEPIRLDLVFDCYHAPFDFHNAMRVKLLSPQALAHKLKPDYFFRHLSLGARKLSEIRTMKGAQHYEQAGHVSGTLTWRGVAHAFQGTGQRDHSWGVRDMRMISQWQWFSCQFGDTLAFNVTRVETLAIEAIGGHAWFEGACHPLKKIALHTDCNPATGWPRQFRLELTLPDRRTLTIQGRTRINFPVQLTTEGLTAVVNEGLAQFEWNQHTSIGISEFMGQRYP